MHRILLAAILLSTLVAVPGLADPVSRLAFEPAPLPSDGYVPGGDRSWPQSTREMIATPVFGDLTGDGTPEVIAADDLYVYAFTLSGTLLWSRNIGNVQMHAAVADLDDDGHAEVAITSTLPTARLWVLDGLTGNPKPGWPVNIPFIAITNLTCPVIIDLNGDGRLDVGTAGEEGRLLLRQERRAAAGLAVHLERAGQQPAVVRAGGRRRRPRWIARGGGRQRLLSRTGGST